MPKSYNIISGPNIWILEKGTNFHTTYSYKGMKNICVPNSYNILYDPNIWIIDTGAACHNTYSDDGMKNIIGLMKEGGVTKGNGKEEVAKKVVDIKITMCKKIGNSVGVEEITDVVHCHNSKFNLYSLSRVILQKIEPK